MTTPMLVAALLWSGLLAAALAAPMLLPSADPGDDVVRNTVRLSLLYYAAAAALMLRLRRHDWAALTAPAWLARCCWTLALLAYLVHVGTAFHFAHGWSHAHAVEETRRRSGVGEGIYVSHFFTLAWTADVLSWWLTPRWYASRSPWWGRALHGFMLFVIFNGTVVFEEGPTRWAGVALVAGLAGLWLWDRAYAPLSAGPPSGDVATRMSNGEQGM
jgi:hypothetical protein